MILEGLAGKLGKRGVVKGSRVVRVVHICQTESTGIQLNVQQWSMGCLAEQIYITMGWQVGKQPVEVPGDWQSPAGSTAASRTAGQVSVVLGPGPGEVGSIQL